MIILEYIVDENFIKIGSQCIWIWVAIESTNNKLLSLFLLKNIKRKKYTDSRGVSVHYCRV